MTEQLSLFEDNKSPEDVKIKRINNLRHLNEARRILASTPSYEEKLKLNRLDAIANRSERQIAS